MEEKWDIYIYDSTLIFCRSWTGIPHYRAKVEISPSSIRINQIETSSEQAEIAPQVVYFLAASHAMGITIPHPISKDVSDDPMDIASHSFSHFGRFACFATREDVTQVVLSDFEGSS